MTLQLVSIKITQTSYDRAIATTLAYQLTDLVRSNCDNLAAYTGHTLCDAERRATGDKRACSIAAPADIAADPNSLVDEDLEAWWEAVDASNLSNWYARLEQPANSNLLYTVIQWDDTHATESSPDDTEVKASCVAGSIPSSMEEVCLTTVPCE
jgi:Tfp pilus assembly protein PilV